MHKERQNGQHCTALDDDIKKIALAIIQPFLENQQMTGRRNRYELCGTLDNAEDDDDQPLRKRQGMLP
jgi:hypothetical protein